MEILPGQAIELPLLIQIGDARTYQAQPIQTWHAHQGFEILFVLGGATAWDFQRSRAIEVVGGHFLLIQPGVRHRGSHAIRKPSTICGIVFNPLTRAGGKNSCFTREDLQTLHRQFRLSAPRVATMSHELTSQVNRLVDLKRKFEADATNPLLGAAVRSAVCAAILDAAVALGDAPATPRPQALVDAAKQFLEEHTHEPVRMSELSKHMGFGRSYLFSIFRSLAGMTPNDFHLRVRIKRAQTLLSDSDESITAIAMDTGFSSSQYFSTVFRKQTGKTPAEFRVAARPKDFVALSRRGAP